MTYINTFRPIKKILHTETLIVKEPPAPCKLLLVGFSTPIRAYITIGIYHSGIHYPVSGP